MDILKKITIADEILIVSVLTVSFVWMFSLSRSPGQVLDIYNADGIWGTYSIVHNTTLNVPGPLGYTIVEVKSGKVYVKSSPCPNKLCVHMDKIDNAGETIVCIPNRVYVVIKGKKQFDTLSY